MKFKTTRKAVVSGSNNIIQVGYCAAWHLLKNHEPIAYTSGMYGWNFDVYQVYGVTICTGYRNMPGRAAKDLTWFEQEARAIYEKRCKEKGFTARKRLQRSQGYRRDKVKEK